MFLRNYWYVAASAPEIGRKPFRRIILNEPIVFYRTEDGTPVASRTAVRTAACRCRWASSSATRAAVPLSRPALRPHRRLRAHARPGPDPVDREGEDLSGGRALQVAVDLDGRSGARRSAKITDYHWLDDPNWGAKSDYL